MSRFAVMVAPKEIKVRVVCGKMTYRPPTDTPKGLNDFLTILTSFETPRPSLRLTASLASFDERMELVGSYARSNSVASLLLPQ